jgi:hypothetical protein
MTKPTDEELDNFIQGYLSDGDVWYGESTNDTVMSYNYQPSPYWWFRQADVDTITGMWVG